MDLSILDPMQPLQYRESLEISSLYPAAIALDFHDAFLWTEVDLSGCDRVRHFTGEKQLSLPENSPTHPRCLAKVHDGEFPVIPFTTALDEDEGQTPYRSISDSSIESDNRWTGAIQSVLEDKFPAGTDNLFGQWCSWRRQALNRAPADNVFIPTLLLKQSLSIFRVELANS
jgi:hypothetical protein